MPDKLLGLGLAILYGACGLFVLGAVALAVRWFWRLVVGA